MDRVRLTLINEGRIEERDVPRGTTLLSGLQGFEDFEFDAPCGGKGTCGKCKVLVEGDVSPADEAERGLLGPSQLERGVRLSCLARAEGACRVTPLFSSSGAAILTRRFDFSGRIDPPFDYGRCVLPPATLEDQRSDAERLSAVFADGARFTPSELPLTLIRTLPELSRKNGNRLTVCSLAGTPWALLSPEAGAGYGIAVDIGTTTIVAYLLDLADGRTVGLVSGMNMQKSYGGDVISRVQAAIDSGPGPLARAVQGQLTGMIFRLMEEAELPWEELRGVSVAGNTVMMHLFSEVDPRHIAVSPFIPAFCELRIEASSELLSRLPARVPVIMLPSVSGFIGADISAGILAIGLKEREKPTLLIDIGTNGELVLGNRDRILACSTAAGPAFEGATISRGVGGIHGAISAVRVEGGELKTSTIGDSPPIGLCGSGIVDLTAVLVSFGIVDETGRLLPPDELPSGLPQKLRERVSQEGFLVTLDRDGEPLYFTPKDVREVQLAKAAVAAGIDVLLENYGISAGEVDRVFLAGGFGSYIDTAGAAGIGLLPAELLDRVQPAGNTAGAGAAEVLLSRQAFATLQVLAEGVQYIELSASLRFQQLFVDRMFFPAS